MLLLVSFVYIRSLTFRLLLLPLLLLHSTLLLRLKWVGTLPSSSLTVSFGLSCSPPTNLETATLERPIPSSPLLPVCKTRWRPSRRTPTSDTCSKRVATYQNQLPQLPLFSLCLSRMLLLDPFIVCRTVSFILRHTLCHLSLIGHSQTSPSPRRLGTRFLTNSFAFVRRNSSRERPP